MKTYEIPIKDVLLIRQKVMWPNKSLDFVKIPNDNRGKHYGLKKNNNIISVISIFFNDNEMQFRKFATLEEFQGKGYGSILLSSVFEISKKMDIKRIWCNARKNKIDFYRKFGMKETPMQFLKEGKEYVLMEKLIN